MRKLRTLLLLVLSLLIVLDITAEPQRKKVAVVLSGGGAKGMAHVRALKVIEEAGIPVDIIVGTSMGACVGALYASGYNAEQMDSIIQSRNWMQMLTDGVDRRKLDFYNRKRTEQYIISANFEKSPFEVVQGGLLKGNSVAMFITELMADHQEPMKFSDLPIDFACVSTDLLTGKEVVMKKGIIGECMRASMAIPGVFAPVKKDRMVLVDGGLANNYPVDVARKMGADIVIGVDVGDAEDRRPSEINTPVDVLSQFMDVATSNKKKENVASTDVYIKVNVKPYSAASFQKEAIDTLLVRGEAAARLKWDELVALRPVLGLDSVPQDINRPKKHLDYQGPIVPPASIYNAAKRRSYIGLGARVDSEEIASILVGGLYEFNHKNRLHAGLNVRLGQRSYIDLTGGIKMFEKWTLGSQYKLLFNDLRIMNFGAKAADVSYTENYFRIHTYRSWRMMRLSFGAEASFKSFSVTASKELSYLNEELKNENNIAYFARLEYDNMDDAQYAHKGIRWSLRYKYYTDNGYKFGDKAGLHIIDGHIKWAIPLAKSTTLSPYIAGRSLSSRNTHFSNMNAIGGIDHDGYYVTQQLSFAGIRYLEYMDNNIAIVGLNLRQRLTTNNYVFGIFNAVSEGEHIEEIYKTRYYGGAIGYGYRSPAGPLEAHLSWSSLTKKPAFYVSLGYKF